MATYIYKGKSVYYEVHGTGKPFFLLNGLMMSTKSWTPFIESFSKMNQLILVDFFDQGQSEKLAGVEYSQDLQVELLVGLLNHLNIQKISIVGISYGGEVALNFAIHHPDKLDRLGLFNTTAFTSPWLKDIGTAWNIAAQKGDGDGKGYYYTSIPLIYSPEYYTHKLEWMRNREKVLIPLFANKEFTEAMIRLTLSAESHDVRNKLALITHPTLIVSSDQDYLTPIEDQKYLADHIKGSQHVIIQKTGHASMYEKPLVFASLIVGFLNLAVTEFKI